MFRKRHGRNLPTGRQSLCRILWRSGQNVGLLELAGKCGPAIGLGYSGSDIVLDVNDGPLIIEVNARPGIEIQNINQEGLKARMHAAGEDFK